MLSPLRALALLAAVLLAPVPAAPSARAAESAPAASPRATVTLLSELDAVAPGQPFRLLLRQRLAPGWHTYWSNPGDAGAPPELRLLSPAGATAGPLLFPAPERVPFGPLVNFGYRTEAAFPFTVTPPPGLAPGELVTVEASASWLVCEQVCIPEEATFRLRLPVEAAPRPDPAMAAAFTAAEAALPRPSPWRVRAGFEGERGAIELEGADLGPATVRDAFFFPAGGGLIDNAAPQPLSVRDGALTLQLRRGEGLIPPGPVEGVVAITDAAGSRGAYAVSAPLGPLPAFPAAAASLPVVALWAALGGLLLNLMPCVFPVLAMKAVGLAQLGGGARRDVRLHAAAYTAGVVVSFLLAGGALIALRAAGSVAGWGFQFTQPAFVAAMAWLMLAVGLNLSGVFALNGPVLKGPAARGGGNHAGSFLTGALAVLVATPCTAPFMAAALGAALAMPPAAALAVFAALGLGMAAPYALLAAFPALAGFLPRPGPWMERARQLLAFPMYGAAAWLAWVLARVAGPDAVLPVLAGGVLLAFAAWAWGQRQNAAGPIGRRTGAAAALAAALGAAALLPSLAAAPQPAAADAAPAGAEPWSAPRLAALRSEGRPVFVNLTAAWCITCKVNERVALDRPAVRNAFAARGVPVLLGDWTRGDPAITALLRRHGRDGVPLYLLFPPGGGEPAVLPQILTEGIVLRALDSVPRS